jgi:hypothetical protein
MANDFDPIIGNWYRHLGKGQEFQVVSVDDDEGIIEIQQFDGDLEQIEFDSWNSLDIELIEPPENWTGPMDDLELDDLSYSETEMGRDDWSSGGWTATRPRTEWEQEEEEEEEEQLDTDEWESEPTAPMPWQKNQE